MNATHMQKFNGVKITIGEEKNGLYSKTLFNISK